MNKRQQEKIYLAARITVLDEVLQDLHQGKGHGELIPKYAGQLRASIAAAQERGVRVQGAPAAGSTQTPNPVLSVILGKGR